MSDADIWEALSTVVDPEIGLDVVTLGLVYGLCRDDDDPGLVRVTHTLTTPGCPLEAVMRDGIRRAVEAVPGVRRAESDLVWDPPWHPGMIRDGAL